MNHHTVDRLPERLTISFPLWLIYGTRGENSPYYDIDKVMREHAERGFNCIRIDSGAGLIHDLDGNLRQPFNIGDMFGEYEKIPRQEHIIGDGGPCDLLSRLIETFECAKKYGIYVILSQWYYLHTYWYHKAGDPVADPKTPAGHFVGTSCWSLTDSSLKIKNRRKVSFPYRGCHSR